MLETFFKDSFIYSIPAILSRGITLFLIPFYTRVLSPEDFGSLDLFIAFATLVNMTIALEVSQGLARFYAAEEDERNRTLFASSAFWFTSLCYLVFLIVMLFFSNTLSEFIMGRSNLELAFKVGVFYIFSNGLFYLIQSQFRWELRSIDFAIVSLVMALANALIGVWLAYFLNLGLIGLLIGMACGSIFAGILGLWWLRKSFRFCFSFKKLREMLHYSTPLVISGFAVWLSMYVDRLMINHFLSIEDVGLYGIGFRISSIAGLAIFGFQGALTPLVFANYKNPDTPAQLEKIFRIFIFFALFMFLFLTLFSLEIMKLMTTPAYYEASFLMIYLVPAILFSNMYIFAPGINIAKKTHYIVWISFLGGFLNIALNFILIPLLGISGAALATMTSYAAIFMAYMVLGQRYYPIPHNWSKIFIACIIAVIIAVVLPQLDFLKGFGLIINFIVLTGFMFILISLGMLNKNEILIGLHFFRRRFK